jgi:hypothetical protein
MAASPLPKRYGMPHGVFTRHVSLIALLCLAPAATTCAQNSTAAGTRSHQIDGLSLALPATFGLSKTETIAADTTVVNFKPPGADANAPVLFTILSQPSAVALPLKEKDDYVMLTRVCASQWLAEIAQHEKVWADDTQTTEIGGAPATRLHIVAPRDGSASNGFLYCVALGRRTFKIATRDAGFRPTDTLMTASHAIEAASFDAAGRQ